MFPPVDTKSPAAVSALVEGTFATLYPAGMTSWFRQIFREVDALFAGKHPDYRPIDLRYHDLEHTLQATTCLTLILRGYAQAADAPRLSARQFQLAIAAVLLHDTGYLKLRSDAVGTGAKYTYCHVVRSCAFAASYLPTLGATELEIAGVLGAINCTGPSKEIRTLQFQNDAERFTGCALVTADYLGQMAAPDYPDELDVLYAEFEESDDFLHVPRSERTFESADDLMARTPGFWEQFVLPKLTEEFCGAYRYLAQPYPHGPNAYLDAVARNMAVIEERLVLRSRRTG